MDIYDTNKYTDDQLYEILDMMGKPTDRDWKLKLYKCLTNMKIFLPN